MPNARLVPAVCALRWDRSPWDRSSLSLREAYHCETPCLTACDTISDCFAQRRAGRNGPPLCGDGSQVLMYYTLNRLSTQSSPTRSSVIMILQVLHCPHCQGTEIVRHGQTRPGKQRYRCREQHCASRTFLLDYCYPGQSPAVKQPIVEMAMHASGIRDTARVLHGSTNIVMTELKKEPTLQHVNEPLFQVLHPEHVEVEICRSEELDRRRGLTSELDEMWSDVRSKAHPRWLWHAIEHRPGKV
jgi:transposase-like protein